MDISFLCEGTNESENENIKAYLTPSTLSYAPNKRESKTKLQRLEHSGYQFGYHPQGEKEQKQDTEAFGQSFMQHNLPSLGHFSPSTSFLSSNTSGGSSSASGQVSSKPYKTYNPAHILTPTVYNSSYLPIPTHSISPGPTSTITSQMFNRDQEQDRKNKIEMFGGNESNKMISIKKEPSLLDEVVYEGSSTSHGLYVNPNTQHNMSLKTGCWVSHLEKLTILYLGSLRSSTSFCV